MSALSLTHALQWRKHHGSTRTTADLNKYAPYLGLAEKLHVEKLWPVTEIAKYIQSNTPALQSPKVAAEHHKKYQALYRALTRHLSKPRSGDVPSPVSEVGRR